MTEPAEAPFQVLIITEFDGLRTEVDTRTGFIRRLDTANQEPSGAWVMTGLSLAAPFGRVTRADYGSSLGVATALQEIMREGVTFKNGKPRLFVNDLDHRTRRTRMAGVKDIRAQWRQ